MKVTVKINYESYVLDSKDALQVMELLSKAEHYKERYRNQEDGGTTYHVYPMRAEDVSLHYLPDDRYRVAKLAGEPE